MSVQALQIRYQDSKHNTVNSIFIYVFSISYIKCQVSQVVRNTAHMQMVNCPVGNMSNETF